MIPIGLPSFEFVFIRLAYLVATLVWIIWALRLALGRNFRDRLRAWRGPVFLLLTGVALYSIWSVYDFYRHMTAYAAERAINYHPVLGRARRLGAIDMPAGTTLSLAVAGQAEAFYQAEFPHPIAISGVQTLLAERYLAMHTDDSYRTSGFTPQNLRLTGLGDTRQAGWICDATKTVVFDTDPDGAVKAFQSCSAASGNLIQGQAVPEAAEIIVSEGRLYLDGRRGPDRWIVHLPQESRFQSDGVTQTGGTLLLDADRDVIKDGIEPSSGQ